jgi:ABC-type glycerol-3-phosphate transport system substrate-binding protein
MIVMTTRRRRPGTLTAATLAATFALAACGGGASNSASDSTSELPAVEVADAVAVDPSADLETNLLPDLVVDNLNDDNKVNLRNYGVGDKPILLWMWAPH